MISLALSFLLLKSTPHVTPVSDPSVVYSPYNWYRTTEYAQSPNPGAYLKLSFTGTEIAVNVDVAPLVSAKVPEVQYPVVRFSVDGGPAITLQLSPTTREIPCSKNLRAGDHHLLLQYVSGYVFLDFWTPVNLLRVTGFTLGEGGQTIPPSGFAAKQKRNALFLGDSITNGDDDIATIKGGITNAVDTQDATLGYPAIVAAGIGAEYGIIAYGGASWDHTAADGHTPGLMKSFSMVDSVHSRLVNGKFSPVPDDVFVNMGENSPPSGDDVPKLLAQLRAASSAKTNIFLIIPFSGRSRVQLTAGLASYSGAPHVHLLDLGNNPYLVPGRPTMYSVDGQHPLASLHALLAAQLVAARNQALAKG